MGDIVKVEIEKNRFVLRSKVPKDPKFIQNGFWSKIENRMIEILNSMNQNFLKYVFKTVLDIVKVETEENRTFFLRSKILENLKFAENGSKIENMRTI